MKGVVAWFTQNPVAANLLMVILIVAGGLAATTIKMEMFPEFSLDTISVSVVYPGAAPEEVEEGICIPIEEEVHAIEGIKKITSTASEGVGSVMIEVRTGVDARLVLDDVKTRIDAISTFPEESEKPVIEENLIRRQVINVAVFGEADERVLKGIGERVRDEISALDGISQVELSNARPYEVSIEVSEEALRRHGLTLDDVANAIRRSSLDLSGGSVKTMGGEILLRTVGQAYRGPEFAKAVVLTRPDGTRILVSDVASVVDGFEDTDQAGRFNGLPVVVIQVFRVGEESALAVSEAVHAYIDEKAPELPAGISMVPWQDNAAMLRSRLELLTKNGLQGLALVFLVLAFFLKFRLSFWVTIGIPLSFLGALMVMHLMGQSVNMLSLFAFILVLGIVVDDAIIVGENIFHEHERGVPGLDGAVSGVQGVSKPVIFAVLTTILAFIPMVYLPGVLGKFFAVIPLTVIPALVFSLVESQLILPCHLTHESGWMDRIAKYPPFRWWTALQGRVSGALTWFVRSVYRPTLTIALEWRYATLALCVSTLLLVGGAVGGGFVKFVFFPEIEGDIIAAQLTMPEGTAALATSRAVGRMEAAAEGLRRELEGEDPARRGSVIRNFLASVGEQPYLSQQRMSEGISVVGPQYGEVVIELVPSEERTITSLEVAQRWRELCGPVPGATQLTFSSALMSAGDPINVQFAGRDVEEIKSAAEELRLALGNYDGVYDARHSYRGGKEEIVLDVMPSAEALGLSRMDLARQVRQGFYGEEAQRIQRGRDEVKIMVRYPKADRSSLFGLESMRVRTSDGDEIPFSSVATADRRQGYSTIRRADRQRTVDVTASVDLARANPNEVLAALEQDVLPGILARHPGVHYSLEGQSSDQAETIEVMTRLFIMALIGIYALMAIPFRSYLQPIIVMTAIPFGLVGAIAGHMIMGINLSMLSVLGLVALAGVVVNDSLVLVDFVNRRRDEGASLIEALHSAGTQRFRPIFLTSMTTFAGLTPLLLERSVQAQFLVPMAVSLGFGVLFSTVISLVFVPASYLVIEDFKGLLPWLYGKDEQNARALPQES